MASFEITAIVGLVISVLIVIIVDKYILQTMRKSQLTNDDNAMPISSNLNALQKSFGMIKNKNDVEQCIIAEFESNIDFISSPVNDLVNLAASYISTDSTVGKEVYSVGLLEFAHQRDPENDAARFWLAYSYLLWPFYSSEYQNDDDEYKARADGLLKGLIGSETKYLAATCMLRSRSIKDEVAVRLLEQSVELRPNWVRNRIELSKAYRAIGMDEDAQVQVESAYGNCKSVTIQVKTIQDIVDAYFNDVITGVYWSESHCKTIAEIQSI